MPGKTVQAGNGFVFSNPQNGFKSANTHFRTTANSHDPNERLTQMGSNLRIAPRALSYIM